ncbi:DUF167 domain-containing protein [Candidatus Parcubacteria bacterium]|nr:MAG: DUF167 domain-containing protein [Candidatus Parcubacteria bacterium]
MKVFVTVKPNSKKDSVEELDTSHFKIQTKSPPRDGKANSAAISALARHLGVPKSRIEIIAGAKSKQKVFEVA